MDELVGVDNDDIDDVDGDGSDEIDDSDDKVTHDEDSLFEDSRNTACKVGCRSEMMKIRWVANILMVTIEIRFRSRKGNWFLDDHMHPFDMFATQIHPGFIWTMFSLQFVLNSAGKAVAPIRIFKF